MGAFAPSADGSPPEVLTRTSVALPLRSLRRTVWDFIRCRTTTPAADFCPGPDESLHPQSYFRTNGRSRRGKFDRLPHATCDSLCQRDFHPPLSNMLHTMERHRRQRPPALPGRETRALDQGAGPGRETRARDQGAGPGRETRARDQGAGPGRETRARDQGA
jgi:hypothetical protein